MSSISCSSIAATTERLTLRHLTIDDAPFYLQLLNDQSFIDNIGDKKIVDIKSAVGHLEQGPIASYAQWGFGLNAVILKHSATLIGICGLIVRDELEHPDIGYAFLPDYWGRGFAREAAQAVLADGHGRHQLQVISAITKTGNTASISVLEKLGFTFKAIIDMFDTENNLYEHRLNPVNEGAAKQ